jgi:hypothetical protein
VRLPIERRDEEHEVRDLAPLAHVAQHGAIE